MYQVIISRLGEEQETHFSGSDFEQARASFLSVISGMAVVSRDQARDGQILAVCIVVHDSDGGEWIIAYQPMIAEEANYTILLAESVARGDHLPL